jgi:hypothetical protein
MDASETAREEETAATIEAPAPTAWPLTMALGASLVAAGLLTDGLVSLLGAGLFVSGAVGWFGMVLPEERTVALTVVPEAAPRIEPRPPSTHPRIAEAAHRARLPVTTYPVTAGIKGGMVGSVVMALLAAGYGLSSGHGVWYPINLLAAGVNPRALEASTEELRAFHADALLMAIFIHGLTSLLVGTLYGMLLPIFPRRPILVGGVGAPLVWTALLYPTIGIINPTLAQRIDWGWFFLSQVGFGLAAGLVVSRSLRIPTRQSESFAERIGLEGRRRP